MKIADIESSLFRELYNKFEAPLGIKIFESVYYVDFAAYDKWIVIDSLSHSTGPLPKAIYYLHLSIKNGLLNEKVILNRLCDTVTAYINPGYRIEVFDDETGVSIGEMEICDTNLVPVLQHAGGGSFRSLSVEIVYAGDAISLA